jgi:hypothetical protein
LKAAGVSLIDLPDKLLWAGGDGSGVLTVSNAYAALLQTVGSNEEIPWLFSIWSWAIPLKIKIFIWLCIKDRPLTWEALQKRGWQGPGRCPLCTLATERSKPPTDSLSIHCVCLEVLVTVPVSFIHLEG